jgi:DNA-binding FadR family transcriptional regulator
VARTGDGRRLGEVLAERIEDDIIETGWQVGSVVGTEQSLMERYGVSRATFREAMRIVDLHGVASMRTGPGGGLVVREPDLDGVLRAVTLQLHFQNVEPAQLTEARIKLEIDAIDLAIERRTPETIARLREHLAIEEQEIRDSRTKSRVLGRNPTHDFHILVASMSGNPPLEMFVRILGRLTGEYSGSGSPPVESVAADVHTAHSRIAEAIIAGDVDAARRRMRRHLDHVTQFLHPPSR